MASPFSEMSPPTADRASPSSPSPVRSRDDDGSHPWRDRAPARLSRRFAVRWSWGRLLSPRIACRVCSPSFSGAFLTKSKTWAGRDFPAILAEPTILCRFGPGTMFFSAFQACPLSFARRPACALGAEPSGGRNRTRWSGAFKPHSLPSFCGLPLATQAGQHSPFYAERYNALIIAPCFVFKFIHGVASIRWISLSL